MSFRNKSTDNMAIGTTIQGVISQVDQNISKSNKLLIDKFTNHLKILKIP